MERKTRTLWWLGQGTLLFFILGVNDFPVIGAFFWCVHACGAIYSQYIQEAP